MPFYTKFLSPPSSMAHHRIAQSIVHKKYDDCRGKEIQKRKRQNSKSSQSFLPPYRVFLGVFCFGFVCLFFPNKETGLWPMNSSLKKQGCSLPSETLFHWRVKQRLHLSCCQTLPSWEKPDARDSIPPRPGVLHSAIGCLVHLAHLIREKVTYLIILLNLQSIIHMKQSCKGKAAHSAVGWLWVRCKPHLHGSKKQTKSSGPLLQPARPPSSAKMSRWKPPEAVRNCQIKQPYGKYMIATAPAAGVWFFSNTHYKLLCLY